MILASENPLKPKDFCEELFEQLEEGNKATKQMISDERLEQEICNVLNIGVLKGQLAFEIHDARRQISNISIKESEKEKYYKMISDVEKKYVHCLERDTSTICDIKTGIADLGCILNDFKLLLEKNELLNGKKETN